MVISLGCALAFTASALAVLNAVSSASTIPLIDAGRVQTFQSIGLFDIAFLVVGLLSARLAERQSRTDVRLRAANQSLATLRALHERIVASIRRDCHPDLQGRIYTFTPRRRNTGYQEAMCGDRSSIFFGELKYIIAESLDDTIVPNLLIVSS